MALVETLPASAQTATLPTVADTYVKSGTPNQAQGGEGILRIQQSGSNRTLIRFDHAAIEAAVGDGSLVAATLELSIDSIANNWGQDGRTVDVHRVAAPWTEAGATWNCGEDSQPSNAGPDCDPQWNGGAYEEDATDSVLHVNGLTGRVVFDVTADVAAFLAGAPNHGWLLKKFDEGASGRVDYVSREGAGASAPRLVVVVESADFDEVPPTLRFTVPDPPIVVGDPTPAIAVAYADGGTGIDLESVEVRVDGSDITPSCAVGAAAAVCEAAPLAPGEHTATVTLRDLAGNEAAASLEFEIFGSGTQAAALTAIADAYLRQGHPNQNQGLEGILRVRQSGRNRVLVRCDAAELAAVVGTGTLLAAHLELQIADNGDNWGPGRAVGAHRLTSDWTEAGATWNCGDDTDPLNQQPDCSPVWDGGAFEPVATDLVVHTNGLDGTVRFDVTADAAAFLAGTADRGWLIKKVDEGASGRVDYASRENAAGESPRLVVTFETAPGGGDAEPPTLILDRPVDGSFVGAGRPSALARWSDAGTGVDTGTAVLLLDGVDRADEARVSSFGIDLELPPDLADGPHAVVVRVSDFAGNTSEAAAGFTVDSAPPEIAVVAPGPLVVDERSPAIELTFADAAAGVDPSSLAVRVDGVDVTPSCAVAAGGATCSPPPLGAGTHTVTASIADAAGNLGQAARSFQLTLDEAPPELAIEAPEPVVIGDPTPELRLTYSDSGSGVDPATLSVSLDGIDVTAACAVGSSEAVCGAPELERGEHLVGATMADLRGNSATASRTFELLFPVEVAFTAPVADTVLPVPVVRVEGTTSPPAVAVEVNGVAAELAGGTFVVESLGLHDGVNHLVAVAHDAVGNLGTATLRVFADTTAPDVSIAYPSDGGFADAATVAVSGLVNDLTLGTVSDTVVTLTVNGVPATVVHRSFLATVPLAPGVNEITAEAVDRAGNVGSATARVTRVERNGVPVIRVLSGDGQSAPASQPLPQPLAVQVVDAAGHPLEGAQVVFRVARGNGTLDGGRRIVLVTTDAAGEARIGATLGTRGGVGVDRVTATAVGVVGEAVFTAVTEAGPPATIHPVSGGNQLAAVGADLPQPLVAVVFDAGATPLAGVPVTFRVLTGGGNLDGGGGAVTVLTDDSGLASASWRLGAEAGLDVHLVEAVFPGLATEPAFFKASGAVPGDPADTEIIGQVLDNQGDPVPGVTLRLRDEPHTAVAGPDGSFRLTAVSPGRVFLIADGSTATRPGVWASLEFELFTVTGVVNTLDRPVSILPIDLQGGILVDETHGGTVTLPGLPGFALEIAPGSVTFPGGGRSGVVSVTAVHADRIPMAPGGGMQPRLIVTIQPAGAHFDPPAAFVMPNVDGLAPGTVTELFSFDHDLGAFVAIGTGTVSEDGLVLRSDPGFGILEAGWHCGAPPSGSGDSAPLSVTIGTEGPLVLCRNEHGGPEPVDITASGGPPLDAVYSWGSSSTGVVALSPSGGGLCPDESSCDTVARAGAAAGRATVGVGILCTTTHEAAGDEIDVINPGVEITAVVICGNEVVTQLRPIDADLTGQMSLTLIAADGTRHRFLNEERTGGDYTDEINFDALPVRVEFTEIEAEWRCGECEHGARDREDAHFMSLGHIRHSAYNCPSSGDATCAGGGDVNVCFTDGGCNYEGPAAVPQTWFDQVTVGRAATGCGSIPERGPIQIEWLCTQRRMLERHPPPPACVGVRALRQGGAGIDPHCPGAAVDEDTVAVGDVYLGGELPCGTNICIFADTGTVQKTVTDRCPDCGLDQIDNFSASDECGILGFDDDAVTLRLYAE